MVMVGRPGDTGRTDDFSIGFLTKGNPAMLKTASGAQIVRADKRGRLTFIDH